MAKLVPGAVMPDFTFDTPFRRGVSLSAEAVRVPGSTALVFLRYYGCPMCQLDIHLYAKKYEAVREAGGQILVVLQSDPDKLAEKLAPEDLPFDIVCDPERKMYRQLEIAPAPSAAKMSGPRTVAKVVQARIAGYQHGEYEGDELQLPAVFIVDRNLAVRHAHYGKTADDVPSPAELVRLLQQPLAVKGDGTRRKETEPARLLRQERERSATEGMR